MPAAPQNWRLYAGGALIVWAAGLQVSHPPPCKAMRSYSLQSMRTSIACVVQYSMWSLQKRPEYKEKIEKPALERSLQDESEAKGRTQWSVRTKF